MTHSETPVNHGHEPGGAVDREEVLRYEQAEENLLFTQFAIDNFWDAVIWTKDDGRINYVNDTACCLLGYSRRDLVTKTIHDIVPAMTTVSWQKHWKDTKENRSRVFESVLQNSENQAVSVRMAAYYMAFKGKEYNCFLIKDLADHFNAAENSQQLRTILERQVAQRTAALREEIEGREKIESVLLDEAEKIQNILDNAGQGFLTFGQDLKVDLECSQECRIMFDGEVWGRQFPDLLYPDDKTQREFLAAVLGDVFAETDKDKHEVYLSLLPAEVALSDNRFIEVAYREIGGGGAEDRKLMAILTDITETKRLREQVGEEKRLLKMVVRAVVQYKELVASIRDYEYFCSLQIDQILHGEGSAEEKLYEVYRHVHTFKGTFSQLDLIHVVSRLDRLESQLSKLRDETQIPSTARLETLLAESGMDQWLDKDLTVLKNSLGDSFLSREQTLDIKSSQVTEIEDEMISLLSPGELRCLHPLVKRLRYRPIKEMLGLYPEYIERLSDRLQKLVKPVTIDGDDIDVNPEHYRNFTKSLVHVFRNAVDHGIESEETRLEQGKDQYGQVKVSIGVEDNVLTLKISDDGAGVDIEKVRQKVIARGLCPPEAAETMSDDELLLQMFEDEISTRETCSEYSGRGMGLSAVREELKRLGGQVTIQTDLGKGTTYVFSIPLVDEVKTLKVSTAQIMDSITERANRYLQEEMDLTIDVERSSGKAKVKSLELEGVIALISLKGAVSAVFAMSFEHELAQYLVQRFAEEELAEEEVAEYLTDTMAEVSNIVLGNTLNLLPKIKSMLTIGTPTTCTSSGIPALSFSGPDMWTASIETNKGKCSVNLFMSEGN